MLSQVDRQHILSAHPVAGLPLQHGPAAHGDWVWMAYPFLIVQPLAHSRELRSVNTARQSVLEDLQADKGHGPVVDAAVVVFSWLLLRRQVGHGARGVVERRRCDCGTPEIEDSGPWGIKGCHGKIARLNITMGYAAVVKECKPFEYLSEKLGTDLTGCVRRN